MKRLYFLCTGNACRSQMAEGFARALLPAASFTVQSAGVETHGLDPRAVAAMAAVGIDISHQQSKLIDPDYFAQADVIITLCGDARDRCPVIPAGTRHLHWPLADPAAASGSPEAVHAEFCRVRDEIKRCVLDLSETLTE